MLASDRDARRTPFTRQSGTAAAQENDGDEKSQELGGACVAPSGKPRRNDAGLRAKIRRLSWLAAEPAVAVYLNTPRPPPAPQPPAPPPRARHFYITFLNVRPPTDAKRTHRTFAPRRNWKNRRSRRSLTVRKWVQSEFSISEVGSVRIFNIRSGIFLSVE